MAFSLASCTSTYTVTQHGGMRDALRMGNTQARISFTEVHSKPDAIAVGALTNLDGEITIFNGKVYTATTADGKTASTRIDDSQFDSASLLSLSYVALDGIHSILQKNCHLKKPPNALRHSLELTQMNHSHLSFKG